MKKRGKKGFQMVMSTLVIIILSIMLLLFFSLVFTETGKKFLDSIRGYGFESNVDIVVESCNLLVDTDKEYAYCCGEKNVVYFDDGKKEEKFTCNSLSGESFVNNRINKLDCNVEC